MIVLSLPCAKVFTRERMTRLGIDKKLQGRIVGFFTTYGRWKHPGPLRNWTVKDLVKRSSYGGLIRMGNCGPKSIEAMDKVLECVGVHAEALKKPSGNNA